MTKTKKVKAATPPKVKSFPLTLGPTDFNKIIFDQLYRGLTGTGNRSSNRTDRLHEDIFYMLEVQIPNLRERYDVIPEYGIRCAYGRKFKIDIVLKDKNTGEISVCILIKAYISSAQKNRANIANTSNGEIFRIKEVAGRENTKVWFITVIGNKTPVFTKDGVLKNMDDKERSYVNFAPLEKRENIYHTTISYDLSGVDYSTKETFKNTLNQDNIHNISDESFTDAANRIFNNTL